MKDLLLFYFLVDKKLYKLTSDLRYRDMQQKITYVEQMLQLFYAYLMHRLAKIVVKCGEVMRCEMELGKVEFVLVVYCPVMYGEVW